MGTIRDGENILGEVFEHTNFGTCSTLASETVKEVYCPLFRYYIGARISIKFTHGNTAGTCVGTDHNVIDPLTAPKISLNGQTHTIYVGGEPAGEGFINAGDVHDFVYDGENWADITAGVIYKGGNDDIGYYEKARNGEIEQLLNWGDKRVYPTITYPLYLSKFFCASAIGKSTSVGNSTVIKSIDLVTRTITYDSSHGNNYWTIKGE